MLDEHFIISLLGKLEITAELRDWEVLELAKGVTVGEYAADTYLCRPNEIAFGDSLAILVEGEAEAFTSSNNETTRLAQLKAGDLVGVITFIGGNPSQISATVIARTNCKILLISRAFFEKLQASQPAIVYFVMRGIVRQLHGVARHMSAHAVDLQNYIYHVNVRG